MNKKGEIEISIETIIVIIIGVTLLSLGLHFIRYDEQSYCNNHKGDCECSLKSCQALSSNPYAKGDKYCLDIPREESICPLQTCDVCKEWIKKNPCQLWLEHPEYVMEDLKKLGIKQTSSENWYEENCFCEEMEYNYYEYIEEKGVYLHFCEKNEVGYGSVASLIILSKEELEKEYSCIPKEQEIRCIKAREMNECEKENQEYILSCEEGYELNKNKCERCSVSVCPIGELCGGGCAIQEPVCKKKELSDLSCSELIKLTENQINKFTQNYERNDKLLLLMIEKGCILTTKK